MAFYDKFPYTNFQELNLDWITQEVSKVRDNRDASDASAAAALASEQAAAASAQASAESATEAAGSASAAASSKDASAEYLEQIGTHTAGAVADWLKENLHPTTPPVDESLTVSGAAADAKVTGDRLSDLNQAIGANIEPTWEEGYINTDGGFSPNTNYRVTDFIPLVSGGIHCNLHYETWLFSNDCIAVYDELHNVIESIRGTTESNTKHTGTISRLDAFYVRITTYYPQLANTKISYTALADNKIAMNGVVSENIRKNTIDEQKLTFTRHNPNTNMVESYAPGYIDQNTGNVRNSSYLYYTNYIPVEIGNSYIARGLNVTYGAYYDEDYKYVSAASVSGYILSVPQNDDIKYVRLTFNTLQDAQTGYLFTNDSKPQPYRNELYSNSFDIVADGSVTVPKLGYIKHDQHTNYVNTAKLEHAYINAQGTKIASNDFWCSDYIELEHGITYYLLNVNLQYCAFYDQNYNYVSSIPASGAAIKAYPFTLPADAKYIRVTSGENTQDFYVSQDTGVPPVYGLQQSEIRDATQEIIPTNFNGNDIGVFNKILCIGDSLTAGGFNDDQGVSIESTKGILYNYPRQLGKLTGCQITNKGVSGISTPEWYKAFANEDLSGHDCAIIQLGVNDGGTFSEEVQQAYANIFAKLKNENNGIIIFVSTILNAWSYGSNRAYSDSLISYVESLNDPDIIILDMNRYDHLRESMAYNAGHLTAYGYWRLAQDYKSYISWYMRTHKDVFRFIQFIGTEYTYTD